LTGKILGDLKSKVNEFKLVPSGGGCFELKVNGELIYSKLQTGQFPNEDEMLEKVKARLKKSA
jgi:selenoprotein W-related protein